MAAICIGDIVCLYSEEKNGFLHTVQTSTVYNQVAVAPGQDRQDPVVPDPSVMCWKICMNSRYKLNKKYRTINEDQAAAVADYMSYRQKQRQAQKIAEAEEKDNQTDQRKYHGQPLIFGQHIELLNVFSGQYLHISTVSPSETENRCMKVELRPYHAHQTKFRIMPKYKFKAEGDVVTLMDQIVLESIKSPGHYIHVSDNLLSELNPSGNCHEANLSVQSSVFTVYNSVSPTLEEEPMIRGGHIIRLFHKEIEGYLCAEGHFGRNAEMTLDVHFRVRNVDLQVPKTVFPSSSAIVYWQIEPVGASYSGQVLRWGQQVRLRHVVSRHYMKVLSDERASVTQNRNDPYTIFLFHPVSQSAVMGTYSFCRIEHLMTNCWLHATQDDFLQQKVMPKQSSKKRKELTWSTAQLRKIGIAKEMQFADVFTMQVVTGDHLTDCRFMAGQLPVLQQFNMEIAKNPDYIWVNQPQILSVFKELKDFMVVNGKHRKTRQKLLRNFRVVDHLMQLLKLIDEHFTERHPKAVIEEIYDVLRVYCLGHSRKNEFYLARHHEFFLAKLGEEGPQSASAAHAMMELVKDNQQIIDRITKQDTRNFIKLLRRKKDYRYLELLGALCVCNGVGIVENQKYINESWLVKEWKHMDLDDSTLSITPQTIELVMANKKYNRCVYHTALGQTIGQEINVLYVSTDNRKTWTSVYDMLAEELRSVKGRIIDLDCFGFTVEGYHPDLLFLEHQLDLFAKLCHGNNEYCIDTITDEQKHVSWEEAFCCLRESNLPARLRSKYCNLIQSAFITSEDFHANLNHLRLTFIYHEAKASPRNKQLPPNAGIPQDDEETLSIVRRRVEELQDWIADYLYSHQKMVANQPDQNLMIEKVLTLVRHMVSFGYYGDTGRMRVLLKPLLELIDGRNDVPFEIGKEAASDPNELKRYSKVSRFKKNSRTASIVAAKYCGLEILELFFNLRFNTRLETFVGEFKRIHERFYQTETEVERERAMGIVIIDSGKSGEPTLDDFLTQLFTHPIDHFDNDELKRKVLLEYLKQMFLASAFFKGFPIDTVLMDLCNYEYDHLVRKSTMLLNRVFSAHDNLFKRSLQAQILVTDQSCDVHSNVVNMLPMLKRLNLTRLDETQVEMVDQFLDVLNGYCCLEEDTTSPHGINQRIIYNQGVLNNLIKIVLQPASQDSMENFKCLRLVQRKTWRLIGALARENPTVQLRLFERLNELLSIEGTESAMALALAEVFLGNKLTCMKVTLPQVINMMKLAGLNQKKAPELLVLIKALVKYDLLDIPLRRNQEYVMKAFTQLRSDVACVLDKSRTERLSVMMEGRSAAIEYTASMLDLLAACAEKGSNFTESLCQSILGVDELLDLLNDERIGDHVKRPLLRFFHQVYFRSTVKEGQEILNHMGDKRLWNYLLLIRKTFVTLTQCAEKRKEEVRELLKMNLSEEVWAESVDTATVDTILSPFPDEAEESAASKQEPQKRVSAMEPLGMCRSFHYVIDGVLPFLQTFYSCSFVLKGRRSKRETDVAHYLALSLQGFVDKVAPLLTRVTDKKIMVTAHRALLSATRVPLHMMEALQSRSGLTKPGAIKSDIRKQYHDYYKVEIDINQCFDRFAMGYQHLYEGANTVKEQLGQELTKEYTIMGSDEELPLGKEFQSLVTRFHRPDESSIPGKYRLAANLIRQLRLHGRPCVQDLTDTERSAQEQLDIRCLQVLRALLHNLIVLIDPNEPSPVSEETKEKFAAIRQLQEFLIRMELIDVVVLHLDCGSDDIVREVLGLLANMLYMGNRSVQESLYKYFTSTREEKFFLACKDRLHASAIGFKERKSLEVQHEDIVGETVQQVKYLKAMVRTGSLGRGDFASEVNSSVLRTSDSLRAVELELDQLLTPARPLSPRSMVVKNSPRPSVVSRRNVTLDEMYNSRNTSTRGSQFLRDPERLKGNMSVAPSNESFRKPGLRVDALSLTTGGPLGSEWYDAEDMDETQLGNDLRQMVREWMNDLPMRDESSLNVLLKVISLMCEGQFTKIQDYLRIQPDNFRSINIVSELTIFLETLLASDKTRSPTIVVSLLQTLKDVVSGNMKNQTVLVDNRVCDSLQTIIRESLDLELDYDVLRMQEAVGALIRELLEYRSHTLNRQDPASIKANFHQVVVDSMYVRDIAGIVDQCYNLEMDCKQKGREDKELGKLARRVGFKYYQLCETMREFKPDCIVNDPFLREKFDTKVIPHYERSTMSIEVVCDGKLSKVYFPTTYQDALRENVKETFNYGINRSETEKINEYINWSQEVMEDIRKTQKLQAMKVTRVLTKAEFWLNLAMMAMSALIMIMIMIVVKGNEADLASHVPVFRYSWGYGLILALSIIHYLITLCVVITFFIIYQPRLPNFIYKLIARYNSWSKKQPYNPPEFKGERHIRINLISFKTFWYIALLGFSLAGTFIPSFCVVHLLHVAEHVQLLKRVLGAITKNGKSLLLIYMFGFIFFAIFTLINFAFYRILFDSSDGGYCTTMYECFVTLVHRASIMSLYEGIPPVNNQSFAWYAGKAVTDLLFFIIITAIGLSMIFGVIVDTFAELRDSKITAGVHIWPQGGLGLCDRVWKTDQEMLGSCFICGRDSHEFENKPGGFEKHVKHEHNQWAYIFFWLHLEDTHRTEHSALEAFVYKKLKLGDADFLPIDRSLALENGKHSSHSHLEILEARIAILIDRAKELEAQQTKLQEEKRHLENLEKCQELVKKEDFDIMSPTLSVDRTDRKVTFTEKPSEIMSDLEHSILA